MRSLEVIVATLAQALLLASPVSAAPSTTPPNIIVIFADDNPWSGYGFMEAKHSPTAEGCLFQRRDTADCDPKNNPDLLEAPPAGSGLPGVATPNLDAIADEGTVFPVAHTGSSVCMPSFKSLVTGRYERTFPQQSGGGRFDRAGSTAVYYLPEFLNDARARLEGTPTPSIRYRSFGFSKIWFNPSGDPHGYTNHGFDCGLRQRGQARYTLDPIFQFIRGNDDDPTAYLQDGLQGWDENGAHYNETKGHGFPTLLSWPKTNCNDGEQSDAGDVDWGDTSRPFFVLYTPNLPHSPRDGAKLVRSRKPDATGATPKCRFDKSEKCIFIPETDGSTWSSGSDIAKLHDAMVAVETADTQSSSYLTHLMFMDYWIGELDQFLHGTLDPRFNHEPGCSNTPPFTASCPALSDTTIVMYLSDNGFKLPGSKASKKESGFRTPLVLRDPFQDQSGHRLHRALASALDVIPTVVDYATDGQVWYHECEFDDPPDLTNENQMPSITGAPLPLKQVAGQDQCAGFDPAKTIFENCGCLPGKSFRKLADFERDLLYGERRNAKGGPTASYLRLRASPDDPPGLPGANGRVACVQDQGADQKCHIRVQRAQPVEREADGRCKLRVYDLLADPDQRFDLMKVAWNDDAGDTKKHQAQDAWNDLLDEFVKEGERCDTTS